MSIRWAEVNEKYVGYGETGIKYRVWLGRITDSYYVQYGLATTQFSTFADSIKFCEKYDKELVE